MLFAMLQGFVPALLAGFVDAAGDIRFVNPVHGGAVHADYVQERLAVDVPAGAGSAGHGLCRGAHFASLDSLRGCPYVSRGDAGAQICF